MQRLMKYLPQGGSLALEGVKGYFRGSKTILEPHHCDPVSFLGKTFKHPVILMSAMFDNGALLSGSRALDFFVDGSIDPSSDWDFYVPGYKESVADMINVLSHCGVTWHLESDFISKGLESRGNVTVKCQVLRTLSSWLPECPDVFSTRLQQILKAFKDCKVNYSRYDSCTISLASDNEILIQLRPSQLGSQTEAPDYADTSGEPFSILRGTVQGATGIEPVQLIIGSYYSGARSCLSMVKDFYATHVQCFIGGWCAGHMYYRQAKDKRAILWRRKRDTKIEKAIEKYSRRGYQFEDAAQSKPRIRHLKDDEALFIDYGDIYRPMVQDPSVLNQWLHDRRENINSIEWTEFKGQIVSYYSPMACLRKDDEPYIIWASKQKNKGPYRLLDVIALVGAAPSFASTLNWTLAGESWNIVEAAKSGSLFSGLPKASPWSWVM